LTYLYIKIKNLAQRREEDALSLIFSGYSIEPPGADGLYVCMYRDIFLQFTVQAEKMTEMTAMKKYCATG